MQNVTFLEWRIWVPAWVPEKHWISSTLLNTISNAHFFVLLPVDEVIATNVKLNDLFDIRLINGSSHLVGILELRHNESSWAPACFYDKSNVEVGKIPENICHDLGHNCAYKWQFVEPNENQGLEHIFLEDTHGNVSWLGVENRCFRHGGFNLYIECITGIFLITF